MSHDLRCYRCGESLAALSLPLSRQDECPACSVYLHVCRMCDFFDPEVPKQCREDDADEVMEKDKLNFCEWFVPGENVFDEKRFDEEQDAKAQLAELFGDSESSKKSSDQLLSDAEDLFK